ncbi:Dipeptidyl aminopeptidase/acylaminoacyl peptidase [Sphingobium sp. AP50]|uniref:Atxe2 family lasso peptide isopeptidase n=1 Tax=Sphingobium sp. AP50 TaxID=1884369 RepID=UPI0008BB41A6|nr:Atxe2 family lasso peptide isopeptidase [Sphingobium sp. AP50]SEJ72924.1 Dipeptidyl aminopeptidase/acylaminoacyl peptidase [Sphingobium sp. AP50]
MLISLAMSLVGAGTAALPAVPADRDCAKILQRREPEATARPIEATDLIETLDIGSNGGMEEDPVFTLSPDQSRFAVAVRRANTAANSYCTGIYIASADGEASLIDAGPGAAFWRYDNFFNTHGFPSGVAKVITPRWSPDGTQLAFLKLLNGRLQLWIWDDQRHSRPAVAPDDDIVDFRFSPDGKSLIFQKRDDAKGQAELNREALRGYHLDDRFFPFASTAPFPRGPAAYGVHTVNLLDGTVKAATQQEAAFLARTTPATGSGTRTADVKPDANGISRVRTAVGTREMICGNENCADIDGQPWITPTGRIRYVRREGWARSMSAIYEWKGGEDKPVRLFATPDILMGCAAIGNDIACAREASSRPRFIDRINPAKGTSQSIFDPNPSYRSLRLGRVERLQWTNAMGVEGFGDLVYPPNFIRGRRYPLIVTQYATRGFLRGGTGDEFPLQTFANAGYLVLSIERPRSPFPVAGLKPLEWQRRDNEDFVTRRSILSFIETKVAELIAVGLVDPDKVGITGLSDGSTTTQFAALHSKMFKAASISGCCWEPSQTWLLGAAIQEQHERVGWPASPDTGSAIWSEISYSRNAERVAFPILIQSADAELIPALEAVYALRSANKPVDVFVFPDEEHIKRQPAHRLSVYRRNLRWFDFWLLDKMPADGVEREESLRWAEMKKAWNREP